MGRITGRAAQTAAQRRPGRILGAVLGILWMVSSASAQQRMVAEEEPAVAPSSVAAEPITGADAPAPAKRAKSKSPRIKRNTASVSARVARRAREPSATYRRLRDSWHAPAEPIPTLPVTGRVPLVLSRVNGGDMVTLVPQRDDGGFSDEDLTRAAKGGFCPPETRHPHPIAPRLLDLVYRTMRHFKAPLVHVVSGYRPDRAGSRHTQGRAIDMVIPGVSNEELAQHVRTFGFVGVGIYPKSGFVHLDVRDRSYFWVDNSMPGERSRTQPHLGNEAAAADLAARARGVAPDVYVPDNEREDRAAALAYQRRARQRRAQAERKAKARQAREAAPISAGMVP